MNHIATLIFINPESKILLYLRDLKPGIPFPGYWDLFGGHIEIGETPETALVREIKEELNIQLTNYTFYKKFNSNSINYSNVDLISPSANLETIFIPEETFWTDLIRSPDSETVILNPRDKTF